VKQKRGEGGKVLRSSKIVWTKLVKIASNSSKEEVLKQA